MDFDEFVRNGDYGNEDGIELLAVFKKFDDFSDKMKVAFMKENKKIKDEKQLEYLMKIM